VSPVPQL